MVNGDLKELALRMRCRPGNARLIQP